MQSVNYPFWVGDVVFLRADASQGMLRPFTILAIEVSLENKIVKQRYKLKNCTALTVEDIHEVVDLPTAKQIAIKYINEFENRSI